MMDTVTVAIGLVDYKLGFKELLTYRTNYCNFLIT